MEGCWGSVGERGGNRIHLGSVRLCQNYSIKTSWVPAVVYQVLAYTAPLHPTLAHKLPFAGWCGRRVTPFLLKMLVRHAPVFSLVRIFLCCLLFLTRLLFHKCSPHFLVLLRHLPSNCLWHSLVALGVPCRCPAEESSAEHDSEKNLEMWLVIPHTKEQCKKDDPLV